MGKLIERLRRKSKEKKEGRNRIIKSGAMSHRASIMIAKEEKSQSNQETSRNANV